MSFTSIFRVNGDVVSARMDLQRQVTTVSNDFLQRGQLTNGRPVLISVPVGETMFTCPVIIHAEDQIEDVVLGGDWLRQYRSYTSVYLFLVMWTDMFYLLGIISPAATSSTTMVGSLVTVFFRCLSTYL